MIKLSDFHTIISEKEIFLRNGKPYLEVIGTIDNSGYEIKAFISLPQTGPKEDWVCGSVGGGSECPKHIKKLLDDLYRRPS